MAVKAELLQRWVLHSKQHHVVAPYSKLAAKKLLHWTGLIQLAVVGHVPIQLLQQSCPLLRVRRLPQKMQGVVLSMSGVLNVLDAGAAA